MIKNLIVLFLLPLFTTPQLSTSTYLPSHSFDFRSCTTGQTVTDSIDGEIIASPINGPICSSGGLSFDGVNDYVALTNWEWGGTTSFEAYVKYDSFSHSRVFGFGSGAYNNNVMLYNGGDTSTIRLQVRQGSTYKYISQGNYDSSTWTHVAATVSGTTMKIYKNGVLLGTKTDG